VRPWRRAPHEEIDFRLKVLPSPLGRQGDVSRTWGGAPKVVPSPPTLSESARSQDFHNCSLGDFLFGLIGEGTALPHHKDFSSTLGVRFWGCHDVADRICHIRTANAKVALHFPRCDRTPASPTHQIHAQVVPTQAGVCGDQLTPNPEFSCYSGSCMLRSPNWLAIKSRDLKTNLVPSDNLANALNTIDLTMMIPVTPFLTCQISVFMTMNLYGVHKRVESMKTQEDVRVLDRFRSPGG
jgi:hypothetical protein